MELCFKLIYLEAQFSELKVLIFHNRMHLCLNLYKKDIYIHQCCKNKIGLVQQLTKLKNEFLANKTKEKVSSTLKIVLAVKLN